MEGPMTYLYAIGKAMFVGVQWAVGLATFIFVFLYLFAAFMMMVDHYARKHRKSTSVSIRAPSLSDPPIYDTES